MELLSFGLVELALDHLVRVGNPEIGVLPVADREQVFEPLFTTRAKGTGLGLTICRQIVERHGGTIELGADPSRGAVFEIRLPER